MNLSLVRRLNLSACVPHKCASGGLNEAYWPLNGKWVGREAWGQGGSCERSQLKGQEINVRRCYERQLLHQLMTSRVKKTVLWESLGETSIKPQQNLTVSRQRWRWSTAIHTQATVVWSRSSLFASFTNEPAILPSKYKSPSHLLTHSSFSSFLASSCLYRGLPRTPNWVGAVMGPTQWCHRCYFQQGWAHWRRPQRGWHPSVREQVAEVPTGLALAPVCITSGERIWDGLR